MDPCAITLRQAIDAARQSPALTEREKHLIGLAVALTRGCQECSRGRLADAAQAGIPHETVQAGIDLVAAVNAGVVLRTAIEAGALAKAPSGARERGE